MKTRYLLIILISAMGGVLVSSFMLGTALSAPRKVAVGAPPAHLPIENVEFVSESGSLLSGWFIPGQTKHGGVLLLHSIRSNRREMLGRAAFLHQAGYSVLLFDFQAHGESGGERITFGYLEALDAAAAFSYLQQRIPGQPIGVIGVSLGGAAALLGSVAESADALVLEAVYPTFAEAVANRIAIRLGPWGRYLAPLFTWQVKLRLGFDPKRLAPLEHISEVKTPVLIIAGTEDEHTTPSDSRRLYARASPPKAFWAVPGAAHQNFYRYAPARYEQRVLAFLGKHDR